MSQIARLRDRASIAAVFAALLHIPTAVVAADLPPTPVAITVASGARQTFSGFGTSLGNWGGEYQQLTAAERETLSTLMWDRLHFTVLRLWMNTNRFTLKPGVHDLSEFRRCYVDSHIIADAQRHGVTTLLLAPDNMPDDMKQKVGQETFLRDDKVDDYALLLADFIEQLKKETGITIDCTGVQNEPNLLDRLTPEQMAGVIKRLRAELDRRGLSRVRIIAPEQANNDDLYYRQLSILKNDLEAWRALAGVASHSYNMAATAESAKPIEGSDGKNLREFWITEVGDNGPEMPNDVFRSMGLAARFLNDVNHRATTWIHFLGFEPSDPKDNATRIIAYTRQPFAMTIFHKYYVYLQLSQAFDIGAVFRRSTSTLDGQMTWTFGKKPHVISAAAQNPDGSWAVGTVNYTADSFADVKNWANPDWNEKQGGPTPATPFLVTLRIEELKDRPTMPMIVHRSSTIAVDATDAPVTLEHGQVTILVRPLELVTLRTAGVK